MNEAARVKGSGGQKGCSRLECSPNLNLEKVPNRNVSQSSLHTAWVDAALLRALNKVLSDLYSFLRVFFHLSFFLLVPNLAEWRDSCRLSHIPPPHHFSSSFPSSSSLHILILLLCRASGSGPTQLFRSLLLLRRLKQICPASSSPVFISSGRDLPKL